MKYKLKVAPISKLPKWKISSYSAEYKDGMVVKNSINYICSNGQRMTISGINSTIVTPCIIGT